VPWKSFNLAILISSVALACLTDTVSVLLAVAESFIVVSAFFISVIAFPALSENADIIDDTAIMANPTSVTDISHIIATRIATA